MFLSELQPVTPAVRVYLFIYCLTDVQASVGDQSTVRVDLLQNERLDVLSTDGNCLFNNIEVCTVLTCYSDV